MDRLHDLLTHSNLDVRTVSASTLATFCLICSGGGRVENVPYGSCLPFVFKSPKRKCFQPSITEKSLNTKSNDISEENLKKELFETSHEKVETDEEGAWLIQACLGRLSSVLSSSFEKKGLPRISSLHFLVFTPELF